MTHVVSVQFTCLLLQANSSAWHQTIAKPPFFCRTADI